MMCLCYNLGMCGRFTLHTPINQLADLFGLSQEPAFAPRYNIAPTQPVAISTRSVAHPYLENGRWWPGV